MRGGRHSKMSKRAAMAVCRDQRTPMRQLRSRGSVLGSLAGSSKANPALTARRRTPSIHLGQLASRTNSPLAKAEAGYLNKNSNIEPGAQPNCRSCNLNLSECRCKLVRCYIGPIFLADSHVGEARKRGIRAPCLHSPALAIK